MASTDDDAEDASYLAIHRLMSAYADTVTRSAWDELHQQFLPDAPLVLGSGERARTVVGPMAIGELIARATAHLALLVFTPLNSVVRIDGTGARARTFISEVHIAKGTGERRDLFGVYHDRLERRDGRWWFAERRFGFLARTAEPTEVGALPDDLQDWMA